MSDNGAYVAYPHRVPSWRECQTCGSPVTDEQRHDDWHAGVFLQVAALLRLAEDCPEGAECMHGTEWGCASAYVESLADRTAQKPDYTPEQKS